MTAPPVWREAPDGMLLTLLLGGQPAALVWSDGNRWRVAAADDARPGDLHPTRDEAKAAAMTIASNRLLVPPCDCPAGPGRRDTDGRCFTCSGRLETIRDIIRRHRIDRGDKPTVAAREAAELAAKILGSEATP